MWPAAYADPAVAGRREEDKGNQASGWFASAKIQQKTAFVKSSGKKFSKKYIFLLCIDEMP